MNSIGRYCCVGVLWIAGALIAKQTPETNSVGAAEVRTIYSRWTQTGTASPQEKALMEEMIFAPRRRLANPVEDVSGPDSFGYHWLDNQNGDTAGFNWIELCGDPLAQFGPTGDDAFAKILLSFPFPFYGATYDSVYVSTNGKLTFGSGDNAWLNTCFPVDAEEPAQVSRKPLVPGRFDQPQSSFLPSTG